RIAAAARAAGTADAAAARHAGRRGGVASRVVLARVVHVAVVVADRVDRLRRAFRLRRVAAAARAAGRATVGLGRGGNDTGHLGGADSAAASLPGCSHGADGAGLRRVRRGLELRATRKGRATTMRRATLTLMALL